jgi:hypothetical protein
LIARGPERDLQVITDLVTVLDVASGKTAPKVKHLRVFKLKHADAEEVTNTLSQLGIEARIAPAPISDAGGQQRLLIAMGSDEQIREVSQVIKALDVPSKNQPGDGP